MFFVIMMTFVISRANKGARFIETMYNPCVPDLQYNEQPHNKRTRDFSNRGNDETEKQQHPDSVKTTCNHGKAGVKTLGGSAF